MQALFLVFIAAAWLNESVLAVGLAPNSEVRRASLSLGLATGAALLLSALPAVPIWPGSAFQENLSDTRLPDFLFAVCFLCLLLQLASGRAHPARLGPAAHRWRMASPLLSGNLAVLSQYFTLGPRTPVAILSASLGLTAAVILLVPVAMAVLDRLHVSLVPRSLRGTPIVILTATLAAIGLTGLAAGLPW